VASALLPWHRSGGVVRNGFALARVADDLGLVSSTTLRLLLLGVFFLPLLGALALAAAVAGWHRMTGLATCTVGALGLAASMVALHAIGMSHPGPVMSGVAGVAALGCGARTARGGAPTDVDHA
jgi:hypothetical protein